MASTESIVLFRQLVGEIVPGGGTDSDTMFTDDQVTAIIDAAADINSAAAEGWRQKAARYADMVDVSEAGESLDLSDLHEKALKQVKYFEGLVSATGGTRIHKLAR